MSKKTDTYFDDNPYYTETYKKLNSRMWILFGGKMDTSYYTYNLDIHIHVTTPTHPIPVKELKRKSNRLFITLDSKKQKRREMLNDERPSECDYCWNVEDASDRFSDRVFKSVKLGLYLTMMKLEI